MRGIPIGTGWFTDKSKIGGGALIDIGVHMLDLAWYLLGPPSRSSVFGMTHQQLRLARLRTGQFDVDDAAFALIRFEGGKSLELATSWAINQPPQQQGTICRIYGDEGRGRCLHAARRDALPQLQRKGRSQGDAAQTAQASSRTRC